MASADIAKYRKIEASRIKLLPQFCDGRRMTPNLWAFIDEQKFFTRLIYLFYNKSLPHAELSDRMTVSNLYSQFFRNAIYNESTESTERTNYPVIDIGIRINSCDYNKPLEGNHMISGGLYLSCSMVYTRDKYIKAISELDVLNTITDLHISVHLLPGGPSQSHIKCLINSGEISEDIFFYLNNGRVNICHIPQIADRLADKARGISETLINEMERKGGILSIRIEPSLQGYEITKILMRNAFVQLLISFEKFLNHLRDSNVPILNTNGETIVDGTDSKKIPVTDDDWNYKMNTTTLIMNAKIGITYEKKYLKYKQKYLELKNKHQL